MVKQSKQTGSLAAGIGALVVSVALSSCSASHPAQARSSSPPSSTPPSVVTTAGTASSKSADPATSFFALARRAGNSLTSAHVVVDLLFADQEAGRLVEVKGSGDELVRNGKVAGQRLTVTAGKARGQVISVSSGTYVRVGGTKMWARSDSKSISPSERALFAFDLVLLTFYSPSYVPALQSGASDVRARLPITAHGVRVTPYAFAVDPANVAVAAKSLQTYSPPAGQVETTVDVDGHGRVIDFEQHETAGGKAFELQVTYSAINGPVVVKAPPANAVVS